MGTKKLQVWLPLLFAVVMIVGMFFGYRLGNKGSSNGFFKTDKHTSLQEALDLIRSRYVDSVNLDSIQSGAIQDMMSELDPHSVYLPPVELKAANEDLAGNFEGIGVQFNIFSDTVNVLYVMPGGPSEKAGLEIGDKLLRVDDSLLTGRGITSEKIRQLIRGRSGSKVILDILRGTQRLKKEVTRGSIPVPSLEAYYMVDATTGYMKLTKFTETSYEEFMPALEQLKKEGMTSLIFDLRGNTGGYMNEAVEMADQFLSGDKLIVYTQGANNPKREYKARRPGLFETGKLVVLVDETSASASEVLAGALQDWDRATIVGRRTFGKGLVQEQYPLSNGAALRLTVARYYTPLGRSIQRPYDHGKKDYMDEVWKRYSNGEMFSADSNKINHGPQYRTPGGKIVYGGGGIMPNEFVALDTATYPARINNMFISGRFESFVYQYYLAHKNILDGYKNAGQYIREFNQLDNMWSQFTTYMAKDSVQASQLNTRQQESLRYRLEANLARFRWRTSGYYQVMNNEDVAFRKALELVKK